MTMTDETDLVDEGVRLHEEALELFEAGDLALSRERLERSVELLTQGAGAEHPDVANVLNALGVVRLRQSDFEDARHCFRRAWRIVRRRFNSLGEPGCVSSRTDAVTTDGDQEIVRGLTHPGSPDVEDNEHDDSVARIAVQALSNLGHLEREAGNWDRAGAILKRAVRLSRRELGENDTDTANAFNNLGMWCKFTGRFELGRKCYRRALSILRRACGAREAQRSPDIAAIYHNLGGLEHTAGNFAAGEPFARQSVAIRRRAFGTTHPDYASDIGGLAALVADQGRHDEAESLYREALAIFQRVLGDDHYEIAVLLHNLAAVEVAQERLESAWDLYRRAAEMKERWLGADHPDLALTLHNLAVLAYDLDRHSAAATFCRQALTIFERNLVETHPTLLACRELAAALGLSASDGESNSIPAP